jgi:hypothetical protein
MSLSQRIRPNSEAAPWVCEEVKALEKRLAGLGPSFIYTVTTVPYHSPKGFLNGEMPRCWGFYTTLDKAIKGLHSSVNDEAGYYTYAVIERVEEGIYAHADEEMWFKYDFKMRAWKEISAPDFSEGIVNYGIG